MAIATKLSNNEKKSLLNKEFIKSASFFVSILLLLSVSLLIIHLIYKEAIPPVIADMNSAALGAILVACVTVFLLKGEEKKEKNSKVFEERLTIYKDFLITLQKIIENNSIDVSIVPNKANNRNQIKLYFENGEIKYQAFEEEQIDEIKDLIFALSTIRMHTDGKNIELIFDSVRKIIDAISLYKNDRETIKYYNDLSKFLFEIVSVFQKELYGGEQGRTPKIEDTLLQIIKHTDAIVEKKADDVCDISKKIEESSDIIDNASSKSQSITKSDDNENKWQRKDFHNWKDYKEYLEQKQGIGEDIISVIKAIHDDVEKNYSAEVETTYASSILSFKNKIKEKTSNLKRFAWISPKKTFVQLWLNKSKEDELQEEVFRNYDDTSYYIELERKDDYINFQGSIKENKNYIKKTIPQLLKKSFDLTIKK